MPHDSLMLLGRNIMFGQWRRAYLIRVWFWCIGERRHRSYEFNSKYLTCI